MKIFHLEWLTASKDGKALVVADSLIQAETQLKLERPSIEGYTIFCTRTIDLTRPVVVYCHEITAGDGL